MHTYIHLWVQTERRRLLLNLLRGEFLPRPLFPPGFLCRPAAPDVLRGGGIFDHSNICLPFFLRSSLHARTLGS